MAKKTEQVTKLSMKTMECQPSLEVLAKLEKVAGDKAKNYLALADVFGIAKKYKPGESDNGPFIAFLGQFKGINLATGNEYTSGKFFGPKMIEESLWGVMGEGEISDVQFAFRIGCKYDASAATKYVYVAESLIKPAENDALAMLQRSASLALEDKSGGAKK